MQTPSEAILLRIFVAEEDRFEGHVLYEEIVKKALAIPMAGATVLPATEGFGHSRLIRTGLCIDAGPRQPTVVEIIDTEEMVERFLPILDGMIETGLVTLEKVTVFRYRRREGKRPRPRTPALDEHILVRESVRWMSRMTQCFCASSQASTTAGE